MSQTFEGARCSVQTLYIMYLVSSFSFLYFSYINVHTLTFPTFEFEPILFVSQSISCYCLHIGLYIELHWKSLSVQSGIRDRSLLLVQFTLITDKGALFYDVIMVRRVGG